MITFPQERPEIEIARLDEPPFEILCRELRWWFVVPEPGRRRRWAHYEYPQFGLKETEEMEVVGRGKVHGEECHEIRYRLFAPDGSQGREAYAYGAIRDGRPRWFGWWNLSDEAKFYTWRDEDFEHDWGAAYAPRIIDEGRYQWRDDNVLDREAGSSEADSRAEIDGNGAGVWSLRVGASEHRCLRVIDATDYGALAEGYIDAEGRTLLFRRYNSGDRLIEGKKTRDALNGSPTLTLNGVPFHHWYDRLAEEALAV